MGWGCCGLGALGGLGITRVGLEEIREGRWGGEWGSWCSVLGSTFIMRCFCRGVRER